MTELAVIENGHMSLSAWGTEFEAAARIASSLSLTEFIPESLKVRDADDKLMPNATAATVAAALLTGQELAMGPMASLRSIDVIKGTPGLRALAMRALVLAAGHDMWVERSTDTEAIVCGQRRGSEHVNRSVWDESRARRMNLWDKPAWRPQRGTMLVARATAECARWTAPERILGLGYTAEELSDGATPETWPTADPEPTPTPKRSTRRRRTPPIAPPLADAPEVPVETEPPPMDEPPMEDEPPPSLAASRAQVTKIQIGFNELGTTNRDDRLAMLSGIVGRDVRSSAELTADEAHVVIEALADLNRQRADDDPAAP